MQHASGRRDRRWRGWVPIAASFGVYFVPIMGPHAAWLVGEAIILSFGADRPWAWKASEIGVALLAQALAWAVVRWSLRGGGVRTLIWLVAFPLVAGLNVAYMSAIPSLFLIEPDNAPELTSWAEHCVIPDVSLMPIRVGVRQPPAGARTWWGQKPDGSYALVTMPACTVSDAGLPKPTVQPGGRVDFMIGLTSARQDGAAVVERTVTGASPQRDWALLPSPGTSLVPLATPPGVQGHPVLASRGDVVAWLQPVAGAGPPVLSRVLIRRVTPSSTINDIEIPLEPFGTASYVIADVDAEARDVLLWRNDRPLLVGFDGQARELPFEPSEVPSYEGHTLRAANGWVSWDGYREDGPYRISWSLGERRRTHAATLGRGITSVAVDPSGAFIAVSETTALSIGDARDVVYVIRTDTDVDVFRRYLPRYARSEVVFFEGGLFGYSDLEGTHVLKVPTP